MQHLAIDHEAPRHVGRLAPEFTVDKVSDTPKAKSQRYDGRDKVRHAPHRMAEFLAVEPQGDEHAREAALEGHASFGDLEQVERIGKQLLRPVDERIAEAPPNNDAQHAVENQVIDLLAGHRRIGAAAPAPGQPPGKQEANDIHQAVPAYFQKSDREDNGIDFG